MITIETLNKNLVSFFALENKQEKSLLKAYFALVQEFKQWLGVSPNLPEFREQWQKSLDSLQKSKDSRFNFTTVLRIAYFADNGGNLAKFTNISSLVEAVSILKHSGVKTGPDSLVFSGPPDSITTIEADAGKSVKAIRESRKESKPSAKSVGKDSSADDKAPSAETTSAETTSADEAQAPKPSAKRPEDIAKMIISYLDDEEILVAFALEAVRLNRHANICNRLAEIGKITATKLPVPTK